MWLAHGKFELALLWRKCDFWDSQRAKSLIHGGPAFMRAGNEPGLAERTGCMAGAVCRGFAEQDARSDVPCLHSGSDWPW